MAEAFTLHGESLNWKTFVANRMSKIQLSSVYSVWHHMRSQDNPDDIASPSPSPRQVVDFLLVVAWPSWLQCDLVPHCQLRFEETNTIKECLTGVVVCGSRILCGLHMNQPLWEIFDLTQLDLGDSAGWFINMEASDRLPWGQELEQALKSNIHLSQLMCFMEDTAAISGNRLLVTLLLFPSFIDD